MNVGGKIKDLPPNSLRYNTKGSSRTAYINPCIEELIKQIIFAQQILDRIGIKKCFFFFKDNTEVPGEKPVRAKERTNS